MREDDKLKKKAGLKETAEEKKSGKTDPESKENSKGSNFEEEKYEDADVENAEEAEEAEDIEDTQDDEGELDSDFEDESEDDGGKGKSKGKKNKSRLRKRFSKQRIIDSFKTDKKSFATGVGFYKLFWVFFIGCFIGVVVEVLFCIFVTEHMYESRQGVIYGPFNPVYGFGAVAMTLVLYFFRKKSETWIFIIGAVIGALFETLCSVYQEYFLGTVSWDYTGSKFSLMGGRTDLVFATFWGILAVIWIKFIYPCMSRLIEKIPNKIGVILTWVLLVFMVFDCIISCMAVDRMVKRHNGTADDTAIGNFLDEHYDDDFLRSIYPNMIFTDTGEVLHDMTNDNGESESSEDKNTEESGTEAISEETATESYAEEADENQQSDGQNEAMIGVSFLPYPFNVTAVNS